MKILITGGAGFIASNIADALIEQGHQVVIIDDLSTGKKQNINPKAKFYHLDIRDKKVDSVFAKEKPDIVNHHAAQIDVRKSVSDPGFDAEVNILGLINLLQNSARYNVKKFINVSSGGVIYGDDAKLPAKEDAPKAPLSPYGISKLTGEYYLQFFSKIHSLKYTTLRYSNVFGKRQDPKGEAGVVAIFSNLLLRGEQPTIYGDGNQTRDYIYVKDVVNANILAIKKGNNEAFNIGTSKETSVNELFRLMAGITGYKGEPLYGPPRPGELARNSLNIEKARKILGWQPEYSLEQGLKETIEWVKSAL